jgi:hypothetical protein
MEYKWIISSMDCVIKETVEGQELQNVVNMLHWRRACQTADYDPTTETGYYVDVYGALALESPDPNDFILYESLTQADVEVWLNEMTEPNPSELDANLAAQIALLENPTEETLPLPWVS